MSQVLDVVSFLRQLLPQRRVQGEHQRFHLVLDGSLWNRERTEPERFFSWEPMLDPPAHREEMEPKTGDDAADYQQECEINRINGSDR